MAALTGTETQAELADLRDWRADQPIKHQGDGRVVLATRFDDWPRYHDALIAAIMELSADPRFVRHYVAAFGGTKIESPERWQIPAVDLVCRRAMAFCAAALDAAAPQSFESWANIYRNGDYAIAHSHPAASASLLYIVDPGSDETLLGLSDGPDPLGGQFAIVDPRYPPCCKKIGRVRHQSGDAETLSGTDAAVSGMAGARRQSPSRRTTAHNDDLERQTGIRRRGRPATGRRAAASLIAISAAATAARVRS